jgi:23S rRNA (uracil1939-C5)-methyltransferase
LWQHIDYEAQARTKQAIIEESFAHLGGLRDIPISPILAAEDPWYYRNKMEFSFHPPRMLGLHRRGRWDAIVDLDVCFLQSPLAVALIREIRAFVRAHAIPCYDQRTHEGFLRHLVIRQGKATGDVLVGIVSAPGNFPDGPALAETLVAEHPEITGVVWVTNASRGDAVQVTGMHVLAGRPYLFERLRDLTFKIGLLTFFQTNTAQAERMIDVVRDYAGLRGQEAVVDLYCGIGTFALALADRARSVVGIELDATSVEAAKENATLNHRQNVTFHVAPASQLLSSLAPGPSPNLVVLDPPRAGAGAAVMASIARLAPERILYVSCNPTTLAPDLRVLVGQQYAITEAQPIDLFPHTYHVECIVRLDRIEHR